MLCPPLIRFTLIVGTFYFIIGAVAGTILILLLLIILSVCIIVSLRRRKGQCMLFAYYKYATLNVITYTRII